jgi:hypothetical protein
MPLHWGTSAKVREENIAEMIDSGMPPKQAVAAGYRKQRESAADHKDVMAETGPTGFAPPNYRGGDVHRLAGRAPRRRAGLIIEGHNQGEATIIG